VFSIGEKEEAVHGCNVQRRGELELKLDKKTKESTETEGDKGKRGVM